MAIPRTPIGLYDFLVYHCGPHLRAAPLRGAASSFVLRERSHPPPRKPWLAKSAAASAAPSVASP